MKIVKILSFSENDAIKKEVTLSDVLATLPDMRGANYDQCVNRIINMYQECLAITSLTSSSSSPMVFKSCFQTGSVTNNSAKSLK